MTIRKCVNISRVLNKFLCWRIKKLFLNCVALPNFRIKHTCGWNNPLWIHEYKTQKVFIFIGKCIAKNSFGCCTHSNVINLCKFVVNWSPKYIAAFGHTTNCVVAKTGVCVFFFICLVKCVYINPSMPNTIQLIDTFDVAITTEINWDVEKQALYYMALFNLIYE